MRILDRTRPLASLLTALATLALAVACGGGGGPVSGTSPSPVAGGATGGLIAFISAKGVGVVDPATGSSTIVAPLPAGGAFRMAGPVWAPAPGSSDEVIYFTVHDDRPAERRTTPGVVPYDWLFMVNPFTGVIEPIAASPDMQSEGPFGLTANSHYLAMTVGCCTSYEVDALDLTKPVTGLKVLAKPPDQANLFTQGAAPGDEGRIAVRAAATGAWYWLNPSAAVLQPFPLKLGPDDGPIAFSDDGRMVAVSMIDKGAYIEPVDLTTSQATASSSAATSPAASAAPQPSPTARRINSKLPHVDALAWSPDAKRIALAVSGQLQIYDAAGKDGTAPLGKYLSGVTGLDWSGPLAGVTLAQVKPTQGPQTFVDALLAATKLPAAADTPAMRPLTKVYLWQFDSNRPSPLSSIAEASAAILEAHPPMAAGVVFHHWAPSTSWAFLGGCYRYRVVIAGSIQPVAATVGLTSSTPCNTPKASASPS
jgi:hypothetical protein